MSQGEIDICNQSLGWLGANLITSFDDMSKESNLCQANYSYLRDAVLEDSIWSFATKRAELPLLDEDVLGYGSSFQLPEDCIRVDKVYRDSKFLDNTTVDYIIEDRKVLSNLNACFIKYCYRLVDTVRFSPNFTNALAYRIAAELAIPLTKSRTLQQQMLQIYQMRLEEATATDSMQSPNRQVNYPSMNASRY